MTAKLQQQIELTNAHMASYSEYVKAVRQGVERREWLPRMMTIPDTVLLRMYSLQVPVDAAAYQIASGGC